MIVNDFKASTLTIGWKAQEMSELLLVHITGKQVYRDLEFEEAQREHRMMVQQKLVSLHQDVVNIMTNSFEVFKNDGPEVGLPRPGSCGGEKAQIPSYHTTVALLLIMFLKYLTLVLSSGHLSCFRFLLAASRILPLSLKIHFFMSVGVLPAQRCTMCIPAALRGRRKVSGSP